MRILRFITTINAHTRVYMSNEHIGIFTELRNGERLEIENPTVSIINFEKGAFFKKYDTCIGKIYLTNERILLLKLIVFEAKNMKIESADQFGSVFGQWFDIPLKYVSNVSTPKKGLFRKLFKKIIGDKKEGLQVEYTSPLTVEKKGLFGKKQVNETFTLVFSIDNKDLWSMKIQTKVSEAKSSER